jgi:conjugal transfer mating pair stabilization protein TraG
MTIFSWGGDIQLYNVLQNIKFFVQDTFYLQCLMYLGAFISAFIANLKFGLDPVKTGIKSILIATVYIQLFLVPSGQKVVIEDVVKNSALQVSDLPYGYAVLLSFTSSFEYYSTEMLESAFSTPNSLKINETGLGFGMSTHLRMMEAMPLNDDLLESFSLYYYNCLRPEIYMKNKTFENISTSDDILLSLEPTVAFETLVYDNGASTQLSCEEAIAWLRPKIDIEAYKYLINNLSSQLGMNSAKVESGIGDMNSVLYGVSKTAKDTLTQSMMRNLLNYGEIESAKLIGADIATATYTAVQAREQTRNTWNIAGKQAVENLPLMRIVYYNLVIGLLIFLSFLSAVTASYKYVGLGVGVLFSLSLWNPIGALINSFYYGEMEEYISSISYLGDFLTIQKMDLISEKVSGMLALMSNIYTYIPIISTAIITGAFFGINAMNSTSGANTGGIGGEVTKGNIDVGHTRIANATINAIDVATPQGHYSNKETGILNQSSQKGTENGLTYNQKDLNDKNGTIESTSSVGKVTASNQGLNDVQSAYAESKIQHSMNTSNERVNTASTTASSEISNSLLEQLNHTQGIKSTDAISNITGTSKETAQAIENSRVQAMEKALTSSLSEQEQEQVMKATKGDVSAGFKMFGTGVSAGIEIRDIDGNSKTITLGQETADKLQNSYKENFSENLKENKQVMNDITTSVENGTSRLSSQATNATTSYAKALKEDNSYKEAITNAQSRGYDLTTQVVEQAVKLQNPNFDNLTSSDKINLTQGYLYDISKGDNKALKDFQTAESIIVSNYANEKPTNNINTPSNKVSSGINDNTNYELDKAPLDNFKKENQDGINNDRFNKSNNHIEQGKEQIENSNRSDILRGMKDWVNANSAPNGLNAEAISNTKKALYGEDKKEEKTGLSANIETLNKEVDNNILPIHKNNSNKKEMQDLKDNLEDLADKIEKESLESKTTKAGEK